VGIVTSSGNPMQSAARVPILISFEVENYAGPDHDVVLIGKDFVKSLIEETVQEQVMGY
jgi:hypothetical protein